MPHDPVRIEDTRAWLRKTALDLDSARILCEHESAHLGNAVAREVYDAILARLPEEVRP
jgi:hypothetical protein